MSHGADSDEKSYKNIASGYLDKASSRLAGDKQYEFSISNEIIGLGGSIHDWFIHRVREVGECRNCKALRITERED